MIFNARFFTISRSSDKKDGMEQWKTGAQSVAEIQFGRWRGEASRISDKFVLIFHRFFLFFNKYEQAQKWLK